MDWHDSAAEAAMEIGNPGEFLNYFNKVHRRVMNGCGQSLQIESTGNFGRTNSFWEIGAAYRRRQSAKTTKSMRWRS